LRGGAWKKGCEKKKQLKWRRKKLHHCHTKQYAFRLQVFGLEFSDIHYSIDFLFLSHWWSNCGGFGLAKTGEEIPSGKEYEQGNPEIEGKDPGVGKERCWRISDRLAFP
jgi:hypothetical protein